MVICDNFGNFGGFCMGRVELIAGNVVSLGSAALCGNELLASSCLENSGFVRLSSTFLAFNTAYGLDMFLPQRASVGYFLRIGAESLRPSNNFLRTSSSCIKYSFWNAAVPW